jgi:polyphosphate kinase
MATLSAMSDESRLPDSDSFLNRELAQIEFNARVLEQARDPRVPLLERLRFLTISTANLDEFFEIRCAGLKQQQALEVEFRGPDGLSVDEQLARIRERAHKLVDAQYHVLNADLLPALRREGIALLQRGEWNAATAAWIDEYCEREVLPVLTPVGLDPAHPFPRVLNKSLNLIARLDGEDDFGRSSGIAVVQVPRSLPRLIRVPSELCNVPHAFVMLSWVVEAHVSRLFPGMQVLGAFPFRVTRNSDLWVEQEDVDDLLHAIKGELPRRNFGDAVRLELTAECPEDLAQFLLAQFGLEESELYRTHGPLNLARLQTIHADVARPDLRYPPFTPVRPQLERSGEVFAALRQGDILLHHPYQSFTPVVEFLRQAARDPDVLAIKMTLYRTGLRSPLVEALIEAARAGKEVTAVVELMARFDEAANVDVASRLQEAGAIALYGVVGYKTHAKLLLVVRREGKKLRRYVHVGTGNYHTGTARAYTDLSLLTCDKGIAADVHALFQQLTGLGKAEELQRCLQAPFTLQTGLVERIEREAAEARAGRPARVIAKMNALCEPGIIRALYRASQAGVEIDLVVRGLCALRPGVKGLSERIRVRSIVGRFLEHSRVFYFHAGGEEQVFLSSADWMQRNFFRRLEACVPVLDPALKRRVIDECLTQYLKDDQQAWLMAADGTYTRSPVADPLRTHTAQESLLRTLADSGERESNVDLAQDPRLLLQVGKRERVRSKPVGRQKKLERAPGDGTTKRG